MPQTATATPLPSLKIVLIKQRGIVFDLLVALFEVKGRNPSESERIDLRLRESELRLELDRLNAAVRRELRGDNPITPPTDSDISAILKNISEVERLTHNAMAASALIELAAATLALGRRIKT